MNDRFRTFRAVLMTALAAAPSVSSAESRRPQPTSGLEVLVDGVARPRYAHDGRWYIEAVKGREYELRIRNPYPVRVAVALSVDGMNTIDARETTAQDARKWVIEPYDTITIAGWQTSQRDAHRFEFTTEARSYGQALGRTANLGIISAVFFRERVAPASPRYLERPGAHRAVPAPAPETSAEAGAPKTADTRADAAASAPTENRFEGSRDDELAATGMGRRTDHAVRTVHLDLEATPAHAVDIRYEFRPQLVRLGVLPRTEARDALRRREDARGFERGFEPGFAPVPPGR